MSLTDVRPSKTFYAIEIFARLVLAFAAFFLPINLLTNDVRIYWQRAREISFNHLPYQDFLWEYPPLTVLPLLYLPLTGRTSLGFHFLFVPTMIAFEYASLCLIRNYRRDQFKQITAYWSLIVVPISMLVWYRFDYMSIFFATVAMLAIERDRPLVWPILLGFLSKLWPVYFSVTLFARRQWKTTALTLLSCGAGVLLWWVITPNGFHTFVRFREGEGFQIESIPGSLLLLFTHRDVFYTYGALNISDRGWQWLQPIMDVASLAGPAIIALCALRSKMRNDIALTAGTVAFVLCVDRLISAQFMMWLAPFVVMLWPQYRRIGILFGLVVFVTDVIIVVYDPLWQGNVAIQIVLVARNLLLVWFTVELLLTAFRPERSRVRKQIQAVG